MQTFTGREYLKIDIASSFGLDKKTWNQRLSWFDTHQANLMEMLPQAKEPALFYAGVKAWQDVQANKPTGYMISLDATSSGLQLLAALTGDIKAAKLCNVIPEFGEDAEAKRQDAYTLVYVNMLTQIKDDAKIERDDVKQAMD